MHRTLHLAFSSVKLAWCGGPKMVEVPDFQLEERPFQAPPLDYADGEHQASSPASACVGVASRKMLTVGAHADNSEEE